ARPCERSRPARRRSLRRLRGPGGTRSPSRPPGVGRASVLFPLPRWPPMPPDVLVETRKLTKVYKDFWGRQKKVALRALNLEINRGEVFGLLGPNGSGKTTTIKLLLGLLFPTDGEAFVFGQPAGQVKKNERIGYLPEESYLYRFLNAEETLDFYGRLFNMPTDIRRRRSAELIE